MFPNVRLLIAAMIASVVALTCGFGIFAAFRVNHEPWVRLPSGSAPLRLAADNGASLSVAAGEPFGHRFQIGEPPVGSGTTALAYSAVEPAEQPVAKATTPAGDDHVREASVPARAPAPAPVAAGGTAAPASAQEVMVPELGLTVEQKATPAAATSATGEPAPTPTSTIAVAEPRAEQASAALQATPETNVAPANAPSEVGPAMSEPTAKVAKRTARTHIATRKHRGHRLSASVVTSPNMQDLMSLQPHFLSAPPPYPPPQAMVRRHRVATGKPASAGSAVGGPLVAPSQ